MSTYRGNNHWGKCNFLFRNEFFLFLLLYHCLWVRMTFLFSVPPKCLPKYSLDRNHFDNKRGNFSDPFERKVIDNNKKQNALRHVVCRYSASCFGRKLLFNSFYFLSYVCLKTVCLFNLSYEKVTSCNTISISCNVKFGSKQQERNILTGRLHKMLCFVYIS